MPNTLPSNLKKVATAPHHELMIANTDDILIVVPEEGFKDTADASRMTIVALQEYARKLGKKCGLVIIANNLLAQDPQSRRNYAEGVTSELFFGVTMVVSSPLARAIGNVAIRLTTMQIPLSLSDSVENGIAWIETKRNVQEVM